MDHQLRKNILLRLIHKPRASFNELWDNDGESNKFAYHLNKLIDEGVVEKFDDGYGLSADGRSLAAGIEGDTGNKTKFPTPTVIVIARDNQGRILGQQRKKEPFFGYWGFVSGKLNYGWNPRERAARDLNEEAGLQPGRLKLRAIEHMKTFEGEELLHHHLMYIFEAFECTGELITETHKAHNEWVSVDEYVKKDKLSGEWLFDRILPSDKLFITEAERFFADGEMIDARLISYHTYDESPL